MNKIKKIRMKPFICKFCLMRNLKKLNSTQHTQKLKNVFNKIHKYKQKFINFVQNLQALKEKNTLWVKITNSLKKKTLWIKWVYCINDMKKTKD